MADPERCIVSVRMGMHAGRCSPACPRYPPTLAAEAVVQAAAAKRQAFFLPEQADGPPPHVKSMAFLRRRNSVVSAPLPKLSMFSTGQI